MQRSDSNWIWIVIAVVVGVVLLGGVGMMSFGFMYPGMMGYGGYGYDHGYGMFPWWGIVMMLFWLLVIGGVIALVVWAVRNWRPSREATVGPSDALETLKQRYARGEITKEEYDRMKHDLL
jgi:putative membrane protein